MDVVVFPEPCRSASVRTLFAIFVVLAPSASPSRCDEAASRPADIPTIIVKIRVEDPNGNPVPNAQLQARAMRSKVGPGAHFGWSHARHGEPADGETDSDGFVELSVPKFVVEGREIGEVTWAVRHPDYVEVTGQDLRVDDDPAVVALQHGRRIIVSAVNERTKKPNLSHSNRRSWCRLR